MPRPRPPGVRGMDWLIQRDHAETVACPDCEAPPGQTCTRTNWLTGESAPLDHMPAHIARIKLAATTQETNP
ncbi:zinc finger domain-containing protein [Nocardia amamiensis]|uniref:zinc finger domain-containing protein n=1 Tax=Nocardia amamiensis TaxID=404578 RepID=UPI003F7D3842